MGEFYNIIGLIGSFIVAAALVPQILKVYRTKSAADLSLGYQVLYVVGLIMIVVYGVAESLWPIYIPCSLELLGGIILLVMKQYYDRKEAQIAVKSLDSHESAVPGSQYNTALTPKIN